MILSVHKDGYFLLLVLPTTPSVCFPKTTSGQYCSIPFKYKHVTYNSCTTADYNRPWWSLRPCLCSIVLIRTADHKILRGIIACQTVENMSFLERLSCILHECAKGYQGHKSNFGFHVPFHREIRQISDQKSVLDSPKGTQSTHPK